MEKLMQTLLASLNSKLHQVVTEGDLITLLFRLEPRETSVLATRLGLHGRVFTLQEVADTWRISPERVRQIEFSSIRKMAEECHRLLFEKGVLTKDDVLLWPIRYLKVHGMSTWHCRHLGLHTVGDLVAQSATDLKMSGMNPSTLESVKNKLARFGIALKEYKIETVPLEDVPSLSVAYLHLCVRGRKTCNRLGIVTIGELASRSADDLLEVKNCGTTTLQEIREKLAMFNLKLKGD